jgi:hypothetical protein
MGALYGDVWVLKLHCLKLLTRTQCSRENRSWLVQLDLDDLFLI